MTDLHLTHFDVHRDHRGVLTAILNVPDQPMNVFNESVLHDLDELLATVEHDETLKALVFRSGKENGFLAGADLHVIERLRTAVEAREMCYAGQELLERLEHLAIPTIAVINGVCLGGGLEFALACRHRLVIDDPRTKLGLPEVELGLLPGWGGTQRLPRLVGLSSALPMLLTGKKIGALKAVQIGLADRAVSPDELDQKLEQFVVGLLNGEQRRRRSDSLVAGISRWFLDRTAMGRWLVMWQARREIAKNGEHYPALPAILRAVSEGLRVGAGHGFDVERDEFASLLMTETHRSLLGLFFQRERARKSETWAHGSTTKPRRVKKVGVIGGGVMGAGIAHWAASQGFEVVLKEVNADLLNAGLSRIRDLFQESVRKHALTESDAASKIGAIAATTEWRAFADVDLAIEAVTEQLDIKREVFRDLELYCPPNAVLVSNTSALSIKAIASPLHDGDRVLGLHFFNPVHRMPLVEIVKTDHSRDEDVALLVEFVRKLGKVPVVTEDSPGFVVNRILFPYLDEAVRLHCEGVPTDEIDRSLRQFGMPMGPLELLDQVGLDVAAHVADSLSSLSPQPSPTTERLHSMVTQGRLGKKSGEGFYKYAKGRKGRPVTLTLSPQSRGEGTTAI
ncbi:MAG: enoyl-CoA hydratase/isomerase family protein, partial [Candidatus Saccharimonas sp.]|nr:enoyl-CoA hydratase/isomerase family protein [Planctomycetaceae bacterium]